MKAEELMVGDWVSYGGTPMRVSARILADMEFGELNHKVIEGIYPVPLTQKILEFNGFDSTSAGSERVYYIGKGFTLIFGDKKSKIERSGEEILTIDSVHQLQHLINLCEIGIEIKAYQI